MEVNGMPLHALVVHAVVVLVPLGALTAVAFAVVPRWRWLLRWPALLLALGSVALVRVAVVSGNDLRRSRDLGGPRIERHLEWATRTEYAVWVFAALALAAWWLLPYAVPLVGRSDRRSPAAALAVPTAGLLAVAAGVVLVFAVITGDAGAQAVWKVQ